MTLVDAGLSYEFPGRRRGTALSLNVSNLLDNTYGANCEWISWSMYGARRTVAASLSPQVRTSRVHRQSFGRSS